jgi:hypothetical protein
VLSGRGLCDELITRPEESFRLRCVVVCDLETSRMRRPWPALGRSATTKKKWIYEYISLNRFLYIVIMASFLRVRLPSNIIFFSLFCVDIYGHKVNVIRIIRIVRQLAMWRVYFDHENISQIWKKVGRSVYGPLIVSDVAQLAFNIARSKQHRCGIYINITERDSVACACVSRFCGVSMGMIWFVYVQSCIRLISLS